MAEVDNNPSPQPCARTAGIFYLIIIATGLSGELMVRGNLISPGDAATTAGNIATSTGLFRTGFFLDSIMLFSDVAVAVLFYRLLIPVGRWIALMAMCFRLAQAAVLAVNLLNYYAGILILTGSGYSGTFGTEESAALISFFLDLHAHGYDLGLLFFGVHCLLLGRLIFNSHYLPRTLGVLVMAAGVTYLVGSYIRFLFPALVSTFSPIYGIAIISELSLCLWLLIKGVNVQKWAVRKRSDP